MVSIRASLLWIIFLFFVFQYDLMIFPWSNSTILFIDHDPMIWNHDITVILWSPYLLLGGPRPKKPMIWWFWSHTISWSRGFDLGKFVIQLCQIKNIRDPVILISTNPMIHRFSIFAPWSLMGDLVKYVYKNCPNKFCGF